jgi:DNA-directed RNA polymerase specialized sigma24 family protein
MTPLHNAMSDRAPASTGLRFPATRLTLLGLVRSADAPVQREAFDTLVTAYWKPIYVYLRLRWRCAPEDAEDITQGFLAAAYERHFFDSYDPAKARFRTFLRVCVDRFLHNHRQAAGRQKRGAGATTLPLNFESVDGELRQREPAILPDVDLLFRQEVVRSLCGAAVESVREECARTNRVLAFRVFEHYDLEPAEHQTYAAAAARFGLTVSQVANHLAAVRRMFRTAALERLRDICATDEEFRLEARELFGVDVT